jgi:DNA-binding GntR family transcriptional regulator
MVENYHVAIQGVHHLQDGGVARGRARVDGSLTEIIEAEIYSGVLAPGMWLKQIDLEERYGCTRLTLRHALDQLHSRKIVQRIPNRGYYVPPIDEAYIKNIFRARALVEMSIVDELIQNIASEALARLSYLASVFADTVRTGTVVAQDSANHEFHRELLKACRNSVMVEIIWDLRMRVPLAVQRANNTPAKLEQAARDHFEMIEALRTKDANRMRTITERHVGMNQDASA